MFRAVLLIFALMSSAGLLGQVNSIEFHFPEDQSVFVSPGQQLLISVAERIDSQTLGKDDFDLWTADGQKLEIGCKLVGEGKTILIVPAMDMPFDTEMHYSCIGEVKTPEGAVMPELQISFRTMPENSRVLIRKFYENMLSEENKQQAAGGRAHADLPDTLGYRIDPGMVPQGYIPLTCNVTGETAPGYLFTSYWDHTTYKPYITITDNYGVPVFFRRYENAIANFTRLPDGRLAVCNLGWPHHSYFLFDSCYRETDTLNMVGYYVDHHDIIFKDNGNHLMMAYDSQLVGMDTVVQGGNPAATVTGLVIQEFDAGHNLIWQWRSWDHFEITDASEDIDLLAENIDYCHGNSFVYDWDDNILLSSRHMDEITKINHQNGDIIWRLGNYAKNNEFSFLNDTIGFSHQHDIRRLENGHITIYDNGNLHNPKHSRALEYEIDEENKTAKLVWSYENQPSVYGSATGNHQQLPDNKRLICWGFRWPLLISEVSYSGDKLLDIFIPSDCYYYRAFRFPWKTSVFDTGADTLDWGIVADSSEKAKSLALFNRMDEPLVFNGCHFRTEYFSCQTELPLTIPPGGSAALIINFCPSDTGIIRDAMTIYSDNADTSLRIGGQVQLCAELDYNALVSEMDCDGFKVWPNPCSDLLHLSFAQPVSGLLVLRNLEGLTVLQKEISLSTQCQLDLSVLPAGVYLLSKESRNGRPCFSTRIIHSDF